MSAPTALDVAIIGLAGVYPGAADAAAFWRNICNRVDAITDADPEWIGPYFEPDTQADDRTYTVKGGFLRELAQVDPLDIGLMPSIAAGADPDHLVALKMARDALRDAGYLERPFARDRAGIVIGRGTYGNRGFASMLSRGFFLDQMMDVIRQLRPDFSAADLRALHTDFKKQLPPYGGDMVGVLTPNAIAGLIANRLDLMGPSYIVDAACASTLIALDAGTRELASGRCDLMIVGGTHVQTPAMLYIQFTQIGALSRGRLRPFQKGSDGTLLGEGCGMLVLKRLADAERDGDRIYAVIKGMGTASDGKAKGLLTPRLEGEVLAMRRAYQSSGIDPLTVDLIEAHGTGTRVGDATEIQALGQIYGARGAGPQVAISAVKSMIGHCLPGTAAASMIKTALALHHKVLPPMLCEEPDPALGLDATPFYINTQARPWVHGGGAPRRAGVNAFGFGGINAHVVLEEYQGSAGHGRVQVPVPAGLNPPSPCELVLLGARTHAQLVDLLRTVIGHLHAEPVPELARIARAAARLAAGAEHRVAVVAADAGELRNRLEQALEKLSAGGERPFRIRGGAAYAHGPAPGRLCVLFPGEGSQYPDMLAELCLHFPQVREWFDFIVESAGARGDRRLAGLLFPPPTLRTAAQREADEQALHEMETGAESVFAASLGLNALFDDLGLKPDAVLGHSTGENTALVATGVRRLGGTRNAATRASSAEQRRDLAQAIHAVNAAYRRLESEGRIVEGCLLSVGGLTAETRAALLPELESRGLRLAMDNCPNQIVVFGAQADVDRARAQLGAGGAICQLLPFGRAYHTDLFKPLADAFRDYFRTQEFGPGTVPLYSACSVGPFPEQAEAIRELAARQWENPVRFTQTVERLYDEGVRVFLELGPGANLTSFVADTLRGRADVLALSSNTRRKPALAHLLQTLAQLYLAGVAFDPGALYRHRDIADLDLHAAPAAPRRRATGPVPMPEVRLPAAWCRPLPSALPADPAPAVAAPVATAAPPPAASPSPAADDPRAKALRSHFDLMREFLDSQSRMLDQVLGTAAPPAPAPLPPRAVSGAGSDDYPLLGAVQSREPGRLVVERRFDLSSDPLMLDHCIGGQPSRLDPALHAIPVIPFTFSMELIAEAAHSLAGRPDWVVTAIDGARGSRWLSFDQGEVRLRVEARQPPGDDPTRVSCRVFRVDEADSGTGPGTGSAGLLVFEGNVTLAPAYPPPPPAMAWTGTESHAPRHATDGRLYRNGLFHGPRLQGCRRVRRWGARAIEVDLEALPTAGYFGFTHRPRLQFDAALLDAAGQAASFWLDESQGPGLNCFPFRVGRLDLYAPPPPAGTPVLCQGELRVEERGQLRAQWDLRGADGRVQMRVSDWEDRVFTVDPRYQAFRLDPPAGFLGEPWLAQELPPGLCVRRVEPFADDLLAQGGGIWGRALAWMALTPAEREHLRALPRNTAQRDEWLLGRVAAKEAARDWLRLRHGLELASADLEVVQDERGAPRLRCPAAGGRALPALSLSHSQGWALAVAGDPGLELGVDYQRLARLRSDDALLEGGFSAAERQRLAALPADRRVPTVAALWSAKEAAAKASGLGLGHQPQAWQVLDHALDPARVPYGSARIGHAGIEYDVLLRFEAQSAVSALCVRLADRPAART